MGVRGTVLVVDDEPLVCQRICDFLAAARFDVVSHSDGESAWIWLHTPDTKVDVIVLDWKMAPLRGLDLLRRLKADDSPLATVPVVMQTGRDIEGEEVAAGLRAGAYYFLTKPFRGETLVAIVNAALEDARLMDSLREHVRSTERLMRLMDEAVFSFKTVDQSRRLATHLAEACPEPDKVAAGLAELMINAIEHGNLGLNYEDKSKLLREGRWREELDERMLVSPYRERVAQVRIKRCEGEIRFEIEDKGSGFDWEPYMQMSSERAFDLHGRGIAIANTLSFDVIEYHGVGNRVVATVCTDVATAVSP